MNTLTTLLLSVFAFQAQAPQEPPPPPAAANPDAARIDEVLTRLEKRGEGLKDIGCKVVYFEEDGINLSRQQKEGSIRFLLTELNPVFLIQFDKTIVDDQVGKREWYYFDGRWLWQALERPKSVHKQEMVRAGDRIDIFDIETAPFVLPFGHKKAKILEHFEVSLAPAAGDDPRDTDHLVCVPRKGSRLEDRYQKLDLFVRRELDLPVRIVITKSGGFVKETADFPDLTPKALNVGLSAKDFGELKEWKGYEVSEEALK